jgi:hypothetical protein
MEESVAVVLINNPCVYSGLSGHNWIGLLDHSLGWCEENAVPCDEIVNSMKGRLKTDEFVRLCGSVASDAVDPVSSKMAMSMATRFDACIRRNESFKLSFRDVCRLVYGFSK